MVSAIIPFSVVTAFAASDTEVTVTNAEIGIEGKTPTAGDRIFTPEVLSVNGDATLKNLIKIDSNSVVWHVISGAFFEPITDETYTFVEGKKYRLTVELLNADGTRASDDITVTFNGFVAKPIPRTGDKADYDFEEVKFGTQYSINLSEGLKARNSRGETAITKAYKNDLVFVDVELESNIGLRSLSATPSDLEYSFSGGGVEFDMPAQDVTLTANTSDKVIEEIRLTSENFAVGSNVEDFKINLPQGANYSVVYSMMVDMETFSPVSAGDFSLTTYAMTVVLKANDNYGFNVPFYANDEKTMYHSQISFDGWASWGSLPVVGEMEEQILSMTGETSVDGMVALNFYVAPKTADTCGIDGNLMLKGYEVNKLINGICVKSGETDLSNIAVLVGLDGDEVIGNFALDKEYVLAITLIGENITTCSPDHFTVNGIKPAYSFKYVNPADSERSYITLRYELPVFHESEGTWQKDEETHWKLCSCGEKLDVAAHTDTDNNEKCDTCGYEMPNGSGTAPGTDKPNTPDDPDTSKDPSEGKDELGIGAIIGIVLGAVAILGIGSFCIYWFVIRKKKLTA